MSFFTKHKPQTLDDMVFADQQVERVVKETANLKRNKHLILHGPRGSGKSETARLILEARIGADNVDGFSDPIHAKTYQFNDFDPILRTWSWQMSMGAEMGCVIIDEVDQLSSSMQEKLRAFVDMHSTGIIIATTNNLHRVDSPFLDRCRCLNVFYPAAEQWVKRAKEVLATENLDLSDEQVAQLLYGFQGSGRNLMDWLEDTVLSIAAVTEQLG